MRKENNLNLMEMSLEAKIKKLINKFSLRAPDPSNSHPWHLEHLHADFIELKAMLWDKNSILTLQEVINHYKDFEVNIGIKKSPLAEDQASSENSEINDAWNSKFIGIFDLLEERDLVYEVDYPFIIDRDTICLKKDLTDRHKLYLFLLVASNLNNFGIVQNILTSEFETVSKLLLEDYFPTITVEEFGQNSNFKGNTEKKIEELARLLRLKYREQYTSKIPKTANKEKGLDIVGWKSFQDEVANMIVLLCQCACGKDWPGKKAETESYESYLDFVRLKPIHSMFIPYGLVHYDESFFQEELINGSLLFERRRFLQLSENNIIRFKDLKSFKIIDELVKMELYEV